MCCNTGRGTVNWSSYLRLFKEAGLAWVEDKATTLGAALAYYTVFSLAPLLLIAIGIASRVFGEEAARGGILHQLEDTVGPATAAAIESMLATTNQSGGSTGLTVVGVVMLLFGASGVFGQLQESLNVVWKAQAKTGGGLMELVRDRFLSFAAVLTTGFLLLVSLILTSVLSALGSYLTPSSVPGGLLLWQGINQIVSLLVITLLFALIYKLLPDAEVAWGDVWLGAAVAALLFAVGKYLFGLYLSHSTVASAFGAAGSLVVVLVWVYYSSQIMLFGAELTKVYSLAFGSRASPSSQEAARSRPQLVSQSNPR
jgi:membrane protein